jgi:hypothetical protein
MYLPTEQNNKTTENGSEKEGSMNVTHFSEIPEESGRPKRKKVPRQLADALNRCLSLSRQMQTMTSWL